MGYDTYLDTLESKSIYIIREAYWEFKDNLALLWSMGKDSTTLLHLVRKAFFARVPVSVIHIDTTFKFREIYEFRDKYVKEYGLKLILARNEEALKEEMRPEKGRFDCCNALKTEALKQVIAGNKLKALLVGIRRDEHAIRAKERYFSCRDGNFRWDYQNQPLELWFEYDKSRQDSGTHLRIHPLLHWREIDVWRYIKKERLPVVNLYLARHGSRYRSIGCECCCQPIASTAYSIDKIIGGVEKRLIH